MSKQKKLTLSALNKLNSEFDQRKTLNVCGDYAVQVDLKFRKSKIQELIMDYMTLLEQLKQREDADKETSLRMSVLMNTLIIKHFTDIPFPNNNDVDNVIKMSKVLIDLGIMEVLFDGENGFPVDQIQLIFNQIDKVVKNLNVIAEEIEKQGTEEV